MSINRRFKGYLIDRDGVLIFAKEGLEVPGAGAWLRRLNQLKQPYLIATNHTTSSPESGAAQLRELGFPVDSAHIHSPLTILNRYFAASPPGRTYARGTPELLTFLESLGADLTEDSDVDTVILGFDQTMDYQAVQTAIQAIISHEARFIALHENRLFKSAEGVLEPGLGAWVRAIEFATGAAAMIVGKPSPEYYRAALKLLDLLPEECVMISDDPLGDLVGAKQAGIATVFVTSGKYPDESVLVQLPPELQPDTVLNSIVELEIE